MKTIKITYEFECGSVLNQVVETDGSKTTIEAMIDNGDFIDFSFPSNIIACDWIYLTN